MTRKYDQALVDKIREEQYQTYLRDVEVTVKPIPDCDFVGGMDPRLLKQSKKLSWILRILPKSMFEFKPDPKFLARIRKPFDSVDSTPIVNEGIEMRKFYIPLEDGYELPLTEFKSKEHINNATVLYYIHGGGFMAGRTEVIAEAMKLLVKNTGILVVSVDYRLAPEHPFPKSHNDCYEGLKWLYDHAEELGGDSNNIFVGGDSAGGNLTLYCANRNIEDKRNMIRGQILLYPTVNMASIKDEYTKFSVEDIPMYEKHRKYIEPNIRSFGAAANVLAEILGTDDVNNVYVSPYVSVSKQMPATFISSGQHDYLTIETLAYARKLVDARVDTTVTIYNGMGHAYIDHIGNYPQAEDCVIDMGDFILKQTKNKGIWRK